MALSPSFTEISRLSYTAATTLPFLYRLFKAFRNDKDVYEIVQGDLITLAASIYAHDPKYFNVFDNEDFIWFLQKYCHSSK